jgi:phosphatidylinositol alpha 1,6-mannosyltransferase
MRCRPIAAIPNCAASTAQAGLKRSEKYSWDRINRGLAETYIRLIRQRQAGSGGVPYRAIR